MLNEQENIEWIEVHKLKPNNYNVNVMDREEINLLARDMRDMAINNEHYKLSPIIVRRMTAEEIKKWREEQEKLPLEKQRYVKAEYEIIDGYHRWFVARNVTHGWDKLPCIVLDVSIEEAMEINYRKNKERGHIDPIKEAEFFKRLQDKGMSTTKIAEKFGLTHGRVVQILSRIKKVTPEAVSMLTTPFIEKKVSGRHLETLAKLEPEKQKELAKLIIEHKLGSKEAEKAAEALEFGATAEEALKKARPPPPPPQIRRILREQKKREKQLGKPVKCPACGASLWFREGELYL